MKKLNVKNIVIKCLISLLLVSSIVMLTNNNITLAYFTSEEVTSDISQLRVNYTHPGDDFFNIIRRFKDNSKKIQRSLIVYYYNDSVEDLSKKNLMTMATDLGENYNEYYRYMVKLTDEQCKAEGFDENDYGNWYVTLGEVSIGEKSETRTNLRVTYGNNIEIVNNVFSSKITGGKVYIRNNISHETPANTVTRTLKVNFCDSSNSIKAVSAKVNGDTIVSSNETKLTDFIGDTNWRKTEVDLKFDITNKYSPNQPLNMIINIGSSSYKHLSLKQNDEVWIVKGNNDVYNFEVPMKTLTIIIDNTYLNSFNTGADLWLRFSNAILSKNENEIIKGTIIPGKYAFRTSFYEINVHEQVISFNFEIKTPKNGFEAIGNIPIPEKGETKTYYHSTSTSSPQWPSLKNEAMDVAGKKSLIITRDDNGDITIEVDLVTIKN